MFCNCGDRIEELEDRVDNLEWANRTYYDNQSSEHYTSNRTKLAALFGYLNLKFNRHITEEKILIEKVKKGGKK